MNGWTKWQNGLNAKMLEERTYKVICRGRVMPKNTYNGKGLK